MLKKIALLLMAMFSLQACIPAALVVGATAGGAIVYDQRDAKTILGDRNTTTAAIRKLRDDPDLANQAHVSVATFNHIVLLVGQTPTEEQRDKAEQIVKSLSGFSIKRIYNEITIGQPISGMTRTQDTWITTKIRTKMLAEKDLHSTQIKVVTEDGTVYLMGLVGHKQAELATNVARRVSGVKKVVEIFEYA